MGENLLPELPCTSSAPASPTREGTRAAQASPDLRPENPGTTGPAPSCSPATCTMQFKTLGNVCFPGEKKIYIYIAALLCLLLARSMFGTCDIMKLQSTANCLSPSSKFKGKAGWLQPASGRAPQHPDPLTILPPRWPAGTSPMPPGPWTPPWRLLGCAGSHLSAVACAATGTGLLSRHPQPKNNFRWE